MRERLIEDYFEATNSLQRAWKQRVLSMLNDDNEVSIAQMSVLFMLREHGPIMGKDLATKMHISRSAVTQLVEGLVESGYVTRKEDAKDRRNIYLSVSKKGVTKIKALDKRRKIIFNQLVTNLSDKQLKAAIEINQKMLKEIEN